MARKDCRYMAQFPQLSGNADGWGMDARLTFFFLSFPSGAGAFALAFFCILDQTATAYFSGLNRKNDIFCTMRYKTRLYRNTTSHNVHYVKSFEGKTAHKMYAELRKQKKN